MEYKDSEEKKWRDHNMNQMCDNLEKSSKVPFVTTLERSVEEIVSDFRETFSVPSAQDNWTPETYPHQLGVINWLTQTLQAERQRCEELVEAERERNAGIVENFKTYKGNEINDLLDEVAEDIRSNEQWPIDENGKFITQPNNPK